MATFVGIPSPLIDVDMTEAYETMRRVGLDVANFVASHRERIFRAAWELTDPGYRHRLQEIVGGEDWYGTDMTVTYASDPSTIVVDAFPPVVASWIVEPPTMLDVEDAALARVRRRARDQRGSSYSSGR